MGMGHIPANWDNSYLPLFLSLVQHLRIQSSAFFFFFSLLAFPFMLVFP